MLEYVKVFFLAMVPVLELRAAIPVGVANGLPVWSTLLVAVIGNMVPVPLILLFIRGIFAWLRPKAKWLDRLITKLEEHAVRKGRKLYSLRMLGLFLLVAIPLPGTGAWTGALVAAIYNIRMKNALPVIALGVLAAGVIMCGITYGVSAIFAA